MKDEPSSYQIPIIIFILLIGVNGILSCLVFEGSMIIESIEEREGREFSPFEFYDFHQKEVEKHYYPSRPLVGDFLYLFPLTIYPWSILSLGLAIFLSYTLRFSKVMLVWPIALVCLMLFYMFSKMESLEKLSTAMD